MTVSQLRSQVWNWLDERLDMRALSAPLKEKTVPVHRHSYWYFLGGLTLFFFMVQIASGLLLLLYYHPSANEAFESVQRINNQVPFGWLIRSLHAWSANLMVLSVFAHLFSVAFTRAFRKPRELTWMTGVLLLFLALGFGFSGYLLPWNTRAYFATKVGTEVAGQVPVIGRAVMMFMRGGEDVTGSTLSRFFALHVCVLPALALGMVMMHLLLVQKHGTSVPDSVEKEWDEEPSQRKELRFFPNFFLRELVGWYVAIAALLTLAVLLPAETGTKADPFASAPPGIKPEWYFLAQFQTLRVLPSKILFVDGELVGVLAFGVAPSILLALPFFETLLGKRGVRLVRAGLAFGLLYLCSMSIVGYLAK